MVSRNRRPIWILLLAACLLFVTATYAVAERGQASEDLDLSLRHRVDEEANVIQSYFARSRAVILLTAQNPSLQRFYDLPGTRRQRILTHPALMKSINKSLAYLGQLYPTSIGEACLIGSDGAESARVVRGEVAPLSDLSLEEASTPFFAPTFALDHGEVHQTRPYVSPDTNEWVIANASVLPGFGERKKAIVHFEVTVESFRHQAAASLPDDVDLRVADAKSGAVIIDSGLPQAVGAPLGTSIERSYADLSHLEGPSGLGEVSGRRIAYRRLSAGPGNANDWILIAGPTDSHRGAGFGGGLVALFVAVMILFMASLINLRVSERKFERQARELDASLKSRDELRERFQSLVQNSSDLIWLIDSDGIVRYASPSSEVILGWTPEDLEGKRLNVFLPHEDGQRMAEMIADASLAPGRGSSPLEVQLRAKGGERKWFEAIATNLLEDPNVRGLIINSRDVTDRRELEQQLARSQRMEAIGQLAGGVAHDFNNLISIISGYSRFVSEAVQDEQVQSDMDEIIGAANRGAKLVQQLLTFSRKEIVNPVVLDANDVVSKTVHLLRRTIGENVQIRLKLSEQPLFTRIDHSQLEQLVINICLNARDAMTDGGRLEIESDLSDVEHSTVVEDTTMPPGRYIRVSFSDNGCGMSGELMDRIFDPFFTTKQRGSGTGLGLSTAYGIASGAHGFISVQSQPGRGSEFVLYLPATATEGLPADAMDSRDEVATGTGQTILVVEDEDSVRKLVCRTLSSRGYIVLTAVDGRDGIAAFEKARGVVDLVLTDVIMPDLSGKEMVQGVQSMGFRGPVIYMSGYTYEIIAAQGLLAEDEILLRKPFSLEELLVKVNGAFREIDLEETAE